MTDYGPCEMFGCEELTLTYRDDEITQYRCETCGAEIEEETQP